MTVPVPEFSRPIEVARVANTGSHEKIAADPKECAALARRLKLPAVHAVAAHLVVKPWHGGGFKVTGQVNADLDQESVVSLEVFRSSLTLEVERYFLPKRNDDAEGEEVIDLIVGGLIDLGEIVAETIGLELDPYPRKPGETFEAIMEDAPSAKVSPFAVLKRKDSN